MAADCFFFAIFRIPPDLFVFGQLLAGCGSCPQALLPDTWFCEQGF